MLSHNSLGVNQALQYAQNRGKYYGQATSSCSHSILVATGSNQPVLQDGAQVFSITANLPVSDTKSRIESWDHSRT